MMMNNNDTNNKLEPPLFGTRSYGAGIDCSARRKIKIPGDLQ